MKPGFTYDLFVRINYLFGLAVIITMMIFSRYVLSIGQFIVAGAWALERVDQQKFLRYFRNPGGMQKWLMALPFLFGLLFESIGKGFVALARNKAAMVLMSVYLLHVAGLIFTSDFAYAMKDLRIKVPIFILPLFLSTSGQIDRKTFYAYMGLFLVSLILVTIMNTWSLVHGWYIDIREVSRYTSHIHLSLMLALGLFTAGYFILRRNRIHWALKLLLGLMSVWFITYMVMTRTMTGLAVFAITMIILLLIIAFRSRIRWLRPALTAVILLSLAGGYLYLREMVRDYYHINPIDMSRLDSLSSRGNPYVHDTTAHILENGNYVWIYIQKDEMREAWSQRSAISLDSLDKKKQPILFTLMRYLTSKGLRKDFDGVNALTDDEVRGIEKGVASVVYTERFSIRGRIYEFLMGYDTYVRTGNPTGFSMMQRLEFWKAAGGIIRENWLTGVGTGDLNEAFSKRYSEMHTKLAPNQRWRAHNQFMTILLAFGVFGLAWFLFAILYPPVKLRKFSDYFTLTLLIILLLSMLTEDTLESQARVTFFWFFYAFFLFARKEEDPLVPSRRTT